VDPYWKKVGQEIAEARAADGARREQSDRYFLETQHRLAARSSAKYRSRIRADGRILCLSCRNHLPKTEFWIIQGGTFINRCKKCSNRRKLL